MQRAEKILPGHWSIFLCQVFEGREQCKGRGNTSVVISASQVPSLASRTKLGAVISGKFSQTHTVLSGFHMLFHVTLTTTLWIGFIVNPHFADEKTEAEEGWGIYRSGWLQNPTPGLPDCGLHAFNPLYSPLCFPGGPVAESACQHRRRERCGFDPWVRSVFCRRKWQPTPVFLPGKFYGQKNLVGYSPWGHRETRLSMHTHSLLD